MSWEKGEEEKAMRDEGQEQAQQAGAEKDPGRTTSGTREII